ncbi:hypothetical protein BDA99DRAFT_519438 [Phascolomyces articulosus]|uniref:Uncharacterized protein n=1 Tax=Phascolomyces articulosus TaxID=60185 RepID=A0AAD5PB65_9FUNG|nr:hypothetical protein BDA99DRAFT_519438 [Phascolomyces articulosus]
MRFSIFQVEERIHDEHDGSNDESYNVEKTTPPPESPPLSLYLESLLPPTSTTTNQQSSDRQDRLLVHEDESQSELITTERSPLRTPMKRMRPYINDPVSTKKPCAESHQRNFSDTVVSQSDGESKSSTDVLSNDDTTTTQEQPISHGTGVDKGTQAIIDNVSFVDCYALALEFEAAAKEKFAKAEEYKVLASAYQAKAQKCRAKASMFEAEGLILKAKAMKERASVKEKEKNPSHTPLLKKKHFRL